MSSYLELVKRSRARRERLRSRPAGDAATGAQPTQQRRPVRLDTEGYELKAAGFEPKERCGKIIWQRPDTGFWVSQEMSLHLLKTKNVEGDQRA